MMVRILQTTVSLPQIKLNYFKCFSRIKDQEGIIYTPADFLNIVEQNNLACEIDNLVILKCLHILKLKSQNNYGIKFFCNLSFNTLANEEFMLSVLSIIQQNTYILDKLVFEINYDTLFANISIVDHYWIN